jgi:hypothetical protein
MDRASPLRRRKKTKIAVSYEPVTILPEKTRIAFEGFRWDEAGAGEGNRTLISGLGSPHSTTEPHPLRCDTLYNRAGAKVQ